MDKDKELDPETVKVVKELMQLDNNFQQNLKKLLALRKSKPYMYNLAIIKLSNL